MKIFKSKYNLFQVLIYFIGVVLFLGALSIFTFSIYLKELTQKGIIPQIAFLIFSFGLPAFISLYGLNRMLISMPIISLFNTKIEISNVKGKEIVYLSEIEKIVFTKVPFRLIFRLPIEGILILTKNGREIYLYDQYYYNSHKLKWILSQFIDSEYNLIKSEIDNVVEPEKDYIKNSEIRFEKFINYKGIWWITMSGLGFIVLSILPFAVSFLKGTSFAMPLGVYFGLVLGCYLLFGYQLHYFRLSENYLIITNHLWIWKQKKYKLNQISEIVFEQPGNLPVSMRVTTKEFKSKIYPAASLRNKTWEELQKFFKENKIPTRKEAHF